MKPLLEKDIQAQCLQYLSLVGIPAWRQNQGLFCDAKGKRRVKAAHIEGISDIIGLIPPIGRFLAVEVKRPGRHPETHQESLLGWVNQKGGLGVGVH